MTNPQRHKTHRFPRKVCYLCPVAGIDTNIRADASCAVGAGPALTCGVSALRAGRFGIGKVWDWEEGIPDAER